MPEIWIRIIVCAVVVALGAAAIAYRSHAAARAEQRQHGIVHALRARPGGLYIDQLAEAVDRAPGIGLFRDLASLEVKGVITRWSVLGDHRYGLTPDYVTAHGEHS